MKTTTTYNIVRLKPLQGAIIEKHRVTTWDEAQVATLANLENYRYFWFEKIETTRTDKNGVITFESKILNRSENYFINAFVETYEDVLINDGDLAQQIVGMGWSHIVKGVKYNWIEKFNKEDKLIEV